MTYPKVPCHLTRLVRTGERKLVHSDGIGVWESVNAIDGCMNLGWNLAVAGALTQAEFNGFEKGFDFGYETAALTSECWDCEGYRDESPDLDKRITARGERETRK